ncbi:MAG: hypothetical protein ACD_39C00636G0010 [uncultured bacterium]|nr:MAG: hypothetical protein ACD_39C00636G0010 [uncultured bacterium]
MNIACIYSIDDYYSTEKPLPSPATIPFGIATIITNLKETGFNAELFVLTSQTNLENTLGKYLNEQKPDLVCFTAVSTQYNFICEIARYVKLINKETHTLIGGHHVSLNPDDAIKNTDFDALCIGEGDRAAVEYAQAVNNKVQPTGIANLWIRNRQLQTLEKNPTADFIRDLDSLPFLHRPIWLEWINDPSRLVTILVGRGCPNTCTYCSNHALSKLAKGKYVRFRSPENILREIQQILLAYPLTDTIFLEVETLTVDLNYTKKLCEKLIELNSTLENPIRFGTNITFNRNIIQNEEFLELFEKAHFKFINIGLESGSEKIRKEVLRRPSYSNSDIKAFCAAAKSHGIDVNLFVLIGIPGETLEDFRETISCVKDCDPYSFMLSIFFPYPGTDLYKRAKELGVLKHQWQIHEGERRVPTLSLPGFSRKQISREYVLFYYNVFKGRKPWIKILAVTIRTLIGMSPRANTIYRRLFSSGFLKTLWAKYSGSL